MRGDTIYAILGVIIVLVAWLFMSPVFIVIGLLIAISNGIDSFLSSNHILENNDENCKGCMFVSPIIIIVIIASFIWDDDYYVSAFGDKLHRRSGCDYRKDEHHEYKMIQLSAFFYGCFSKCEDCYSSKALRRIQSEYAAEPLSSKIAYLDSINSQLDSIAVLLDPTADNYEMNLLDSWFEYDIFGLQESSDNPTSKLKSYQFLLDGSRVVDRFRMYPEADTFRNMLTTKIDSLINNKYPYIFDLYFYEKTLAYMEEDSSKVDYGVIADILQIEKSDNPYIEKCRNKTVDRAISLLINSIKNTDMREICKNAFLKGYLAGEESGQESGYEEGFDIGHEEGLSEGEEIGYDKGRAEDDEPSFIPHRYR